MEYTIVRKAMPAVHVLLMRAESKPDQIGETLGRLFPRVVHYASQNQIAPVGPPLCRYLDWNEASKPITIEAGIPVGTDQGGDAEVVLTTFAAGDAVTTIHQGPYDDLNQAYAAIEAWIKEHNYTPAGPPYESYLNDPGEVDPADLQTQIVWPVA